MGLKSTVATGLARKCELIRAKLLWRPVFYSLELSVLPFALTVELEQFSKQLEAQKEELRSQQEQWVAIRTYSYVPPRPLEPMTRRRLLRHNAIEAWERMQKTGWRRGPPPCAVTQDFLGFGWVPGHLNVDLPADVHLCPQSKVHAIGAVDELLKLLRCDSFADFPDAEGRAFRANRTERVVVKTCF